MVSISAGKTSRPFLPPTSICPSTARGAVYHSGRRRAGRLGFAVFAGGYFALAFLGLSAPNLAKLPTTWLLVYMHDHGASRPIHTVTWTYTNVAATSNVNLSTSANTLTTATSSPATPARWRLLLPVSVDYEAFGVVGHCLFALLAGLIGMAIARRYEARRDSVRFDQ